MKRIDLDSVYSSSGMIMKVIDRLDDCCLAESPSGSVYEVFKVNHNKTSKRFGKEFPAYESVPSGPQWGWPSAVSVVGKARAKQLLVDMAHHHRQAKEDA